MKLSKREQEKAAIARLGSMPGSVELGPPRVSVKGQPLSPTLEAFEFSALVEVAAPVVLSELVEIRARREAGVLELTPEVVARIALLQQAAMQLLALSGAGDKPEGSTDGPTVEAGR